MFERGLKNEPRDHIGVWTVLSGNRYAVTLVVAVHATAPGRLADGDSIGGAFAGAAILLLVDQGFQQQRSEVIVTNPISGEPTEAEGERMTGQMGDSHPGQGQEATLIHQAMEVAPRRGVVPADPPVPWLHAPGGVIGQCCPGGIRPNGGVMPRSSEWPKSDDRAPPPRPPGRKRTACWVNRSPGDLLWLHPKRNRRKRGSPLLCE